jgi:nucleoside 2-deoxyribosyltransferase
MKIYIASKTRYAENWKRLRERGVKIISTWIDEAGEGQIKDRSELAQRSLSEIQTCDVLLLYVDKEDHPKGAYFEAGAALALNKPIKLVAPLQSVGVFQHHPLVSKFMTVSEALNLKPDDDLS